MQHTPLLKRSMTVMLALSIALVAGADPNPTQGEPEAVGKTSLALRATIAPTVLTSGSGTTRTSFIRTATVTPASNGAVFAAIESGAPVAAVPTASGNGLTWVQVASVAFAGNARRLTVFRAMGASPTAGKIKFTFPQAQTSFIWSVIQLDGVDTTGTAASGATVQSATNAVTGATTIAANLAPLENANNLMLTFVGLNQNASVTHDSDFIERSDNAIGSDPSTLESETALNQMSCTPTFATAAAGVIAIEVRSGGVIALGTKWNRHTIAAGSTVLKGSDGVHLADINGDGRLDVVSGHEQGNKVSVSLHPGFLSEVQSPWPTVVLPTNNLGGPEDAVFADVDRDGHVDVIVGAEGDQRVVVLFAPTNPGDLLTPSLWTRMDLGKNVMRVMRVAFANVAGASTSSPEIVVGGKESSTKGATIGYYSLTTPSAPRTASSWTYTSIRPVGWVMQMFVVDIGKDNDLDIVYTDREKIDEPVKDASAMGLRWLESSGGATPTWTDHAISPAGEADHKWFDMARWDSDNDIDIADCRSKTTPPLNENSLWLNDGGWLSWTKVVIPPPSNVGECQHITFANVDNAGGPDVGITHSHSGNLKSGVIWLHNAGTQAAPVWERGEISGNAVGDGIKFDNLIWYDIDNDGDLDAVTSEQHEPMANGPGLGVIWYENPLNP